MKKTSKSLLVVSILLTLLFSGRALVFLEGTEVYAAVANRYLKAGIADFEDENYEEALDSLLKAYGEEPSAFAAYYLGRTYKKMLRHKEARKYLEESIVKYPPLADAYAELGEVLYSLRLYPEAAAALTKASEQGVKPAYTAYFKGLVFLKSDKPDEAIAQFEKARELNSSYAQKAAYSTGLAYLVKRKMVDAHRFFEEAVRIDPDSDTAVYARRAVERLDRGGAGRGGGKSMKYTLGYSVHYDDNVLLKPLQDIPGVDISGEGDVGHVLSFKAAYDSMSNLRASYYFYQSLHHDLNYLNVQVHSASLTPYLTIGKGEASLTAGYDHIFLETNGYLQVFHLRPSYTYNLDDTKGLVFSLSAAKKGFLKAPANNDEDRDGVNVSAGVSWFMRYKDRRGYLSVGYAFDTENTDGVNWDYTGNKVTFNILHPLDDRISLSLSGRYYNQKYKNTYTANGIQQGMKRSDDLYYFSPALTYRLTDVSLRFSYSYAKSNSNIVIFDYYKNTYAVDVEYSF